MKIIRRLFAVIVLLLAIPAMLLGFIAIPFVTVLIGGDEKIYNSVRDYLKMAKELSTDFIEVVKTGNNLQ